MSYRWAAAWARAGTVPVVTVVFVEIIRGIACYLGRSKRIPKQITLNFYQTKLSNASFFVSKGPAMTILSAPMLFSIISYLLICSFG